MINESVFENAGAVVERVCEADDYILALSQSESHETRFAQNAITQHMAGSNCRANLMVAYGNKTGSASLNQLDEASLERLVKTAQQIAAVNQPDPEYVATEPQNELPSIDNYAENTAAVTAADIVESIQKCVKNAEGKGAKVSGLVDKRLRSEYVVTKNGFVGQDSLSTYSHSMTLKKDDVETKVSKSVKDIDRFDLGALLGQLNSQFDSLAEPESLDAQRIPVILRPEAVANLFEYLYMMMDMRDADEGVSPFTGQYGKRFFGDRFTLRSLIDDPALIAPRYSSAGLPSRSTTWVEAGTIENLPTTRYYAKAHDLSPTFPFNLVIEGGDASEQEMMRMVDRGLIINNFWYIRFVDQKRGELTGMTRDGVLYFEDGKIRCAVNNFRWNEVIHEATRRILALGESIAHSSHARIPTMLIDDFNLVDATTF